MTVDTSIATIHGVDRMKDRCNMKNQRSAVKSIRLALMRGKRAEDCTSWERSYLSNEAYADCVAIAYNGFCYIINSKGQCVTVYPLPAWFGKKKHFDGKERIRDYKKYCKNNAVYQEQQAYA